MPSSPLDYFLYMLLKTECWRELRCEDKSAEISFFPIMAKDVYPLLRKPLFHDRVKLILIQSNRGPINIFLRPFWERRILWCLVIIQDIRKVFFDPLRIIVMTLHTFPLSTLYSTMELSLLPQLIMGGGMLSLAFINININFSLILWLREPLRLRTEVEMWWADKEQVIKQLL